MNASAPRLPPDRLPPDRLPPGDLPPGDLPPGELPPGELPPGEAPWALAPGGLPPAERWLWHERLWHDVCALRARFRLPVRSGWWEDAIQVEALAALAAWVARYDGGEWDDPPGKLALLYDLERVAILLRDGGDAFLPERDRHAFVAHLLASGCAPP
jgi:hypothetical protein